MRIPLYQDELSRSDLDLVVECLKSGGIVVFPTDSVYGIGCDLRHSKALEKLLRLKEEGSRANTKAPLPSLLCYNLSQASEYAHIENEAFRLIKANSPAPITYILPAGKGLPRSYKGRKEVGIRIPEAPAIGVILRELGSPIANTSLPPLSTEVDEAYGYHPELIEEYWADHVDLVIDGGICKGVPSTVVECTSWPFSIVREGARHIDL